MKIYCDYCGTQIDTEIQKNCPNCGGSYSTDEELIKAQKRQDAIDEIDTRMKLLQTDRMELENERFRQKAKMEKEVHDFSKIIKYIAIALFIGFFIYAVVRTGQMMDHAEKRMDEYAAATSGVSVFTAGNVTNENIL